MVTYHRIKDESFLENVPGGLCLTMMRLLQIGIGCLAWFLPTVLCVEQREANPGFESSVFTTFIITGILAWILPMYKITSYTKWPAGPGPESMMACIAGFFSCMSGICFAILKEQLTDVILLLGLGLNVAHTTILFGTPVAICSNHAFRLFFVGDTDFTVLQTLNNMEEREKLERKISKKEKKDEDKALKERKDGSFIVNLTDMGNQNL